MKVSIKYLVSLAFVILPFTPVLAEVHPIQARGDQQLPHQQERQKARQDWLSSTAPAIRLLPPKATTKGIDFLTEAPCFNIDHVALMERDQLPWFIPLKRLT